MFIVFFRTQSVDVFRAGRVRDGSSQKKNIERTFGYGSLNDNIVSEIQNATVS